MAVNKSLPCPLCGVKIQRLEMTMIRNSLIAEHLRVTHKRTPDEIMVLMDKYTLPLESDEPQIRLPMFLKNVTMGGKSYYVIMARPEFLDWVKSE